MRQSRSPSPFRPFPLWIFGVIIFRLHQVPLLTLSPHLVARVRRLPSSIGSLRFSRRTHCPSLWTLTFHRRGYLSRAVLAPPSLSYKSVTPRPRDRGNKSHDPTRDSSRDPFATRTSCDLSARDPGNLQPCDPGKIPHDLSRNWSSTTSPDKMRFGHASNPLINTWQIVGTINKTRPLNNQRTRDATQSTRTRLIRARP